MKKAALFIVLNLVLFACNETGKEKAKDVLPILNSVDNAPETAAEYCYRNVGKPIKVETGTLRDTTWLQIHVDKGNKATGDFNWLPAEKDAMKGTFSGAKQGDHIKAVYSYIQEGMPATQPVEIFLTEKYARVFLNKDKEDEVMFEIQKANCP